MRELNRRLQSTFLFDTADLRANRSGRLSPRQQARLRVTAGNQRLAMLVFSVVMVGTLGVIAIGTLLSGSNSGMRPRDLIVPLAVMAVVVGGVILIGYTTSRRYMVAAQPKQMTIARGIARHGQINENAASFELLVGAARVRLLTQEQLDAFQPGVEYRLFYLDGPTPTLLSAEVAGDEGFAIEAEHEGDLPMEQDPVIRMQRRARPILIVLAALALGIPLLGFAASALPAGLRWPVFLALLAAAITFVYWSLKRLNL